MPRYLLLLPVALLWLGLPLLGWAMHGWQAVEKILTAFVMPVGLVWNLAIAAGGVAVWRRQASVAWHCVAFVLLLGIAGNSWVAGRLNGWLEQPVAEFVQLPDGPWDAVVLLGGSTKMGPGGQPELGWDGQRLLLAAQLYHSGRTQRIIATGGNPVFTDEEPSHAEQAKVLLESIGVPAAAIECLKGRNTGEEMRKLAERFAGGQAAEADREPRIGLITNAGHMPRAMRLAERQGLRLEPLPCAFLGQKHGWGITSIVPSHYGLTSMSTVCYEWLGSLVR